MISAIVFDFDGVLADSEAIHLRALKAAFGARGWSLSDADYYTHYLGFDDRGCIAAFTAREGLTISSDEASAVLRDKEQRYAALLSAGDILFPTVGPCLERLSPHLPLAIASGSLRGEIEHILDANGIRHYFQTIIGADDVREGKPAPESYTRAVEALGFRGHQAVAIEDSPWGLQSARAAGLYTFGITTSYRAASLTDAHEVIDSLDAITPERLQQLAR